MTPPRRAWVEQLMGMPISVHLRGSELDTAEVAQRVAAAFDELRRVDSLFSTYRPDSQISQLNRGEFRLDDCDALVREVAALCDEARRRTGGYFDPRLPAPAGGTWYDPSGLVKGWAVERVVALLRRLGGLDVCVNAGGDVRVAGTRPWRVGIEDPHDPARLLATVTLVDGAVATSGTAHRGAHIIDPYTGAPAQTSAATVTGPSLTWADVYATAAAARGTVAWLQTVSDYDAMLVDRDGTVAATTGWSTG